MKNKETLNKKEGITRGYDFLKFTLTSLLLPIIIGSLTAYITYKMDKPKEYVIRETYNMNNFKILEYFPLKVDNYWIYERNMEYINDENKEVKIKDEVTKKVIANYNNGELDLFVIQGDPLARKEKGNDPNSVMYGYIIVSNKIIEVPKNKINYIIGKFKNKESLYEDDINELSILFEFPLFNKQKYGEFNQLFRKDSKYINNVTELQPYKKRIGESIIDVGIYTIDSVYSSGNEQISYTPYVGITEYSRNSNGTMDNYYIRLKEYKVKE